LHRACVAAFQRPANYWHMLPEAAQARKAIWNAVNPHTGKRRIDEAFPQELRKSTRENEMQIEFVSGGTWQVVGSDNFNSLVGSSPAGVVYSEWALAKPAARALLRPILAENNGWEVFIYTPRGRNHGLRTLEAARRTPGAFAQVLDVNATGVLTPEQLERERLLYAEEYGQEDGESFFLQEWHCDFNAAMVGAILARYIGRAEREGRINDDVEYDPEGAPIEISSDIGRRDTSAWWFWQPRLGGFSLIDYDEGSGLDAEEWIARLDKRITDRRYKLGKIWLPHDAKARQFAAKHSAIEQFLTFYGGLRVGIVPDATKSDRINAARSVMRRCEFNKSRCEDGLDGLTNWRFEYNEERKEFTSEPVHDWASHPGDGFSYGALVMSEREPAGEDPKVIRDGQARAAIQAATKRLTYDQAFKMQERRRLGRVRL